MRTALLRIGFAAAAAAASSACGPAPQPAAAPPVAVDRPAASVAAAPATVASISYDLSPVPEPSDIIGIARWRSPGATIAAAASTAGVSSTLIDAGSRGAIEAIVKDALRGMVDHRQLAPLVALDAPVDAVAALDPKPKKRDAIAAVSIGLTSLERAKEAAEAAAPIAEITPGVWRIGGKERFHAACVIAASAGSTPARLVCGRREADVAALAPYLTRTLPTLPAPTGDGHGELRFAPIEARYGGELRQLLAGAPEFVQSQLSINEPKFDRTLGDAAAALADEVGALTSDLDKVMLDVGLAPSGGLVTTGALRFRGKRSWLVQTMTDRTERAGPPPPLFWRLPKDSDSAFYARGADPARYEGILTILRRLLDGALIKSDVGTPADRKALVELIALPFGKDTTSVSASGHADANAKAAGPKASPQKALEALANGWLGWHVVGIDEGPAAMTKYLKDLVSVYNRTSLLAPVRKELHGDAKMLPTVKTVAAPAALGAGALDVEIKVADVPPPNLPDFEAVRDEKGKVKLTLAVHVLLMADGKTTWVALGADRDELVKRLLSVKSGGADAGTLASRAGLDSLRTGTTMSGGFFTLSSFTKAASPVLQAGPDRGDPDVRKALDALARLPNHGDTPILMTNRVTGGGAPSAEVAFNLPHGAIQDLASMMMNMFK